MIRGGGGLKFGGKSPFPRVLYETLWSDQQLCTQASLLAV